MFIEILETPVFLCLVCFIPALQLMAIQGIHVTPFYAIEAVTNPCDLFEFCAIMDIA